jgi:hypothetical protein
MSNAQTITLGAIRCQLNAIANLALANDALKLHVRCALRDALERLKRPGEVTR